MSLTILATILKKKFQIYSAVKEWGFATGQADDCQIAAIRFSETSQVKLCLVVKTNPDLIKTNPIFTKNEKLRISYLQDELAVKLNCDLLVYSADDLKNRSKKISIKAAIDLQTHNNLIIKHFGSYQLFKTFKFTKIIKEILCNPDNLNAIQEFKSQLALRNQNYNLL